MFTIEVPKNPSIRTFTSAKGKQLHKLENAWAHLPGSPYPVQIAFLIPSPVIEPGKYTLAPDSFRVGQYNALEVRPVLLKA